jgi:prepilin signal peptidase PulO-like enzyme (type II secretory pathway)
MIEAVSSLAIVLILSSVFSLFIYKRLTPHWDSRENYGYNEKQWKTPLTIAIIVAAIFTPIIAFVGVLPFVSVALGLLVFFLTITALTDAKSHLIPKELSNMALLVGLIVSLVGFGTGQYYAPEFLMSQSSQLMFQVTHFGVYMFAISMLFVVIMFSPVIGFGDIKMFWATGLFIGSFFVLPQLLAIFMLNLLLMGFQLAFNMVKAKSWKVSGGLPALPAFAVAFISVTLVSNLLSSFTY